MTMTVSSGASQPLESNEVVSFLAEQIGDCETQWSLGTFGALAEFSRDADEPTAIVQGPHEISAVTPRGGIRIAPPGALRLFASEGVTKTSWSQRIALCLPEGECRMSGREVLTELGPDRDALREQDRDAILFDLGLGTIQIDACIRVADPYLCSELRAFTGRSLFAEGNHAMGMILAASPHRVFLSRLGRAEALGAIPPADGKSPEGPHTHVLPRLLKHQRTHSANEPVPDGYVPCAHLYPAHPVKDMTGRAVVYDARRHDRFQGMLSRFGDAKAVALKQRVMSAVAQSGDPAHMQFTGDRFACAGIRITLRQMHAANMALPALPEWIAWHDKAQPADPDIDETMVEARHAP
jgi:hypothetical protein